MFEGIRALCVVSVLCGAALSITPDGGAKKIAELLCASIMVIALLSPIKSLNFDDYALQSAKLRQAEQEIISGAANAEERLNRLVIEKECTSYIENKAKELGISEINTAIEMRWDLDGLWVPWAVEIKSGCSETERDALSAIIKSDLGIPHERQRWSSDG